MGIWAIDSFDTLPASLRAAAIDSALRPSIMAENQMNWRLWL